MGRTTVLSRNLGSVCVALALLIVQWAGVAAAREAITVLAFEYPPIYQDAPDKGLGCEIVAEAFRAVDIDVQFDFYPVIRMVNSVSSGKALCGIGGMVLFSDPGVRDNVVFSDTIQYVLQGFLFYVRKYPSGISFTNLSDMRGYSIGVLNGSGIMKYPEADGKLTLVSNVTHDGSAMQLHENRIDVWGIVDLTGIMYMKKLYPNEYKQYRISKEFNRCDISLVFSKALDSHGVYNAKFRSDLWIINKNGTYMKIMEKYYGGVDAVNMDALPDDMR